MAGAAVADAATVDGPAAAGPADHVTGVARTASTDDDGVVLGANGATREEGPRAGAGLDAPAAV